ncbi:MAG TPA: UDP-N-acetylmuramoyl-tripeptide--D-alanyl-D-alanine ligase [Bryobacteraceae bacterium]
MKLELSDITRALGLELPLAGAATGFSTDSRTAAPGDLFFALRGPNHDGHQFVETALAQGAVAAVVESGPGIVVPDTQAALERLAAWARRRWGGTLVAITGSAGKTTTKEVVAQLLAVEIPVGKTVGNLNNHIGVPLSILRLPDEARAAVIEIGMNHAGEIRHLAAIAKPSIGVVTNVGFAHAEFFESADGVAMAKRELIESLGPTGVAVLNADDANVRRFAEIHPGRTVTYGIAEGAEVRAQDVEIGPGGMRFRVAGVEFQSPLAGRHNLSNVLAGLAVAGVFGIAPERLRDAVGRLEPAKMRGERFVHRGITVLNDCYNSNPEAVRSMLDVLRVVPAGRRIAVLGEMLELGRWSESLHRDIGRYAAGSGVNVLVGIRGASKYMVEESQRSGLAAGAAFFFDEPAQAGELVRRLAAPGDVVLFKGSRGTHVERALETFLADESGSAPGVAH